jgi:hypothetical protein
MNEPQGLDATSTPVESVIAAFAGDLSGRGKAPRQNLSLRGCRLCGDVTVSRAGDDVVISAARASGFSQFVYIVTLLGFAFALAAVFLLLVPFLPGLPPGWASESDVSALRVASIIAAALYALNAGVMVLYGRGDAEHVRVRRSDLRVSRSGRSYVLHGPLGLRGKRAILVLRPASKADRELVAKVLE